MHAMRIDIVSLFPEISCAILDASITGRAQRRSLVEIRHVNLRDYSEDERGTVDDTPFGGGAGMLLKTDVILKCLDDLRDADSYTILLCPQGRRFTERDAERMSDMKHLIFFCGHYEGIDERARQALFDDELSLGDFVLTNGVAAASIMADAVIRLLPGVLGDDSSSQDESYNGEIPLLEYPHYTRPASFQGMEVPDTLLSGDHGKIEQWRREQRLIRTAARRPDILRQYLKSGEHDGKQRKHTENVSH